MSPQLFPDLSKIVFLDDDVVVQHDLSSLWEINLHGKVVGAVVDSWCGQECCPGRKYKDYFNFTNPVIASSTLDFGRCGWLYGMNVFDLMAWRKTNITAAYHQWLKLVSIPSIDLVKYLAPQNAWHCIPHISCDARIIEKHHPFSRTFLGNFITKRFDLYVRKPTRLCFFSFLLEFGWFVRWGRVCFAIA